MNTNIVLGSLSSGTMRKEDLVPLFVNEILRIDSSNDIANRIWSGYCEFEDNDLDEYWESESSSFDLDDLFDELNNICDTPYVYFGSHPGDGADYGFWVNWESIEDDIRYGDLDVYDVKPTDCNGAYVVRHGNVTELYQGDELILSSWEIQ